MQQFMAYLHNKEVYDEVEPVDVVESLYEFFEKRYEIEDIKFAAVYDFLASTSFYAGISRVKLHFKLKRKISNELIKRFLI